MTTERQACGLGAFLPMSCRGRAEAFARRLQTRLQHLGGSASTEDPAATEETWLTNQPVYPTNHQPRLNSTSSESDIFYDFDMDLESPGSPLEEASEAELREIVLNKRRGKAVKVDCAIREDDAESGCVSSLTATSPGSDSSDGNYYDPESFEYPAVQPLTPLPEEVETPTRRCNGNGEEVLKDKKVVDTCATKGCGVEGINGAERNNNGAVLCNGKDIEVAEEDLEIESKLKDLTIVETASVSVPVDKDLYLKCNGGREVDVETDDAANGLCDAMKVVRAPCVVVVSDAENGVKNKSSFCSMFTLKTERLVECPDQLKLPCKTESIPEGTKEDDDDDEEDRPRRVQRCSSLKTGKTPPGTPGRKKIVRFADVLGLDLADVRTFLDEVPKVPKSAYEDLPNADYSNHNESLNCVSSLPGPLKTLMPLFQQPGGCPDFLDRVRRQKVCLENAMVKDMATCTIVGTVRVLNLDFNKSVHIRYSLDGWLSFSDLQATYVMNSCDGFSDTFSFMMYANTLQVGQRLEFAVRFQCHGAQYWDSNNGANYVFQCLPPSTPGPCLSLTSPTSDRWASFY